MKISAARKMRRNKYRVDCRIYRLEKGDARAPDSVRRAARRAMVRV